ncbi:hypothetical protein [Pseudosulfitobacter pseudonitzschiae]|uniref:hypothetical protein n=1 Tax=Pseudosulfitobacter pseudonitzschiae TaxID=1402135 RepID=UPI003B7930C8
MTKYVLRAKGRTDPVSFTSDEEDPKVVFEGVLDGLGVEAHDVYSFWRVGKAFRVDSRPFNHDNVTVSMWDREPGEELIFKVRSLPELSDTARAVLAGTFAGNKTVLTLNNQESCLSEIARGAFDELIEAGLLLETEADNGYDEARTYRLSEDGRNFPRNVSPEFMSRNGRFPLVEKIEADLPYLGM